MVYTQYRGEEEAQFQYQYKCMEERLSYSRVYHVVWRNWGGGGGVAQVCR